MFYVYFESVLIPLFLIIGLWGVSRNLNLIQKGLPFSLIILFSTLILLSLLGYNVFDYLFTDIISFLGFAAIDINITSYNLVKCTALVSWGTSLGSALGWYGRNMTKQVRSMYSTMPYYIFSIVIRLILSDGGLQRSNRQSLNSRLSFKQSLAKFEYFWSVYYILAPYISTPFFFLNCAKIS